MQRFLNAMKAQAGALDQAQGQLRFGTVSSVDPQSAAVRVTMQPEGVLSGWLPVASAWTGNGWGLVALPSPGDQVIVLPHEGDAEHGVVIGGAFSTARPPPQAPCGEFWLVHQSGSFLKLANDGAVYVQGDLHVAGDVYDRHGALSQLRADYNGHRHANAASVPDKQD